MRVLGWREEGIAQPGTATQNVAHRGAWRIERHAAMSPLHRIGHVSALQTR
jgi:hypothetical protein